MAGTHAAPIRNTRIDGHFPIDLLLSRPIFYFDLAPILARAGDTMLRNPQRLEIVCDHCVRSVTATDPFVFVESGFYVIVTSGDEPQASQLADRISVSLLKCFFGDSEMPPGVVAGLVRKPSPEEISILAGETASPHLRGNSDIEESQLAADAERSQEDEASRADPLESLADHGIHAAEGFRFGFTAVHDLRRGIVPTFFCSTIRMRDEQLIYRRDGFESIGPRDLPCLERAMLLHALSFSRRLTQAGLVAVVGTSVSFETLAWSKGRQLYQAALQGAASGNNSLLIVKIDMIPPGTPSSRLGQLVAAIRPYVRRIFVRLPRGGLGMIADGNLCASGYVTSLPVVEEAPSIAARFARLCNNHGALSCIDRIFDATTIDIARAAGVRFAEGRAVDSRILYSDMPAQMIADFQAERRDASASPV